tara:strand:+ start:557 stop:1024 length:468 start_codon:yes stop_codon:yes gene_type:complete
MARRRSRRKTARRRTKRGFNVVNAAELYLTTDVLTRNFMGTNPLEFFTGQTTGVVGTTTNQVGRPVAQMGMGYFPSDPATITLPELLGFGSATALSANNLHIIKNNFKARAMPALIQYAGVKIGFNIGKKILSKQRSFINNQVLKPLGMKSTVVV